MIEPSLRIKVTDFLATDFEQEVFQELMKIKQSSEMQGVHFPLYFWYDREYEYVDLNEFYDPIRELMVSALRAILQVDLAESEDSISKIVETILKQITLESDGSVRFYYDMQVTNSSNGKSVVIPIYESFDFDEDGKALYVQWYCDWTASIESLE